MNRPFVLRGLIADVYPYQAPDEELISAQLALKLVPSSAEGVSIERKVSNARIEAVKPLEDMLAELSVFAAEAVTQYMLSKITDPDAPIDKIREVMVTQNAQVVGIAAYCIVAHLLEAGALELKKE